MLTDLGVPPDEQVNWNIGSKIVTDQRLLVPIFRELPVTIVSYDELKDELHGS